MNTNSSYTDSNYRSSNYKGPLAGLKVIDFGHYFAGPMAAMLLADQGADVIRIVRPGKAEEPFHQEIREQQFRVLNRNKKLLVLDLKTPEGRAQAQALVAQADVLIENFRPGVMQRLGLDYATCKKTNPRLIYLSMPGFSATDKERAQIQAWEGVLCAAAGVYRELSVFRELLDFPPLYTRMPQCSSYGAIHGNVAIMAALLAREEHGVGTVIEVPLVDAGLSAIALHVGGGSRKPPGTQVPEPMKLLVYSPEDTEEQQWDKLVKANEATASLGSTHFFCADGRKVYIATYLTQSHVEKCLKTLGINQQVKREGFVNGTPFETGLDNNLSLIYSLSPERSQRMKSLISEAFLAKPAEEWENLMRDAGVPVAMVRTREEWLQLEPMLKSGVLTKIKSGDSELTMAGRMIDVGGPEGSLMDIQQWDAELISAEEAEALFATDKASANPIADNGAEPLKKSDLLRGLKVLDMANVIAGPTSAHTLALFGAEVIKLDTPGTVHPMFLPAGIEINQGKRSILAEINTAPGRELFGRLVNWADVAVHNILDDKAQRLGVTHAQLQAINPAIVSCQLTAFGGTLRKKDGGGGWETQASYDPQLQGVNGLMAEYGALDQPMWHGNVCTCDVIGGLSLALSALLSLYQRRRTGHAGEARTSLARVTNHYQLPFMISENGRCDWGEVKGQFAVGDHPWQRMYACTDGWIYVGTTETRASALAETVTGDLAVDAKALEKAFAQGSCADWLKTLGAADIGCHRVQSAPEVAGELTPHIVSNDAADATAEGSYELLRWEDHPCGNPVNLLAPTSVRIGEQQSYKRLFTTVKPGQNTEEILQQMGYSNDEINDLLRLKVCYDFLPGLGSKERYF